jgi:4-amino-4-deoxy-L-arabinose transferase-like glycosyltransferase
MPLALFVTAALSFFWLGHFEKKTGYYYLAWISAGLATLTKGPVGFILPAGAILIYILATRQFTLLLKVKPVNGMIVFLMVTAPWYVLVCQRNPDFFDFFFINQNLLRYTTTMHERYKPFWYFVPVVIVGFLPWTFMLPAVVKQVWKNRPPLASEVWFTIIWFAVTFLFFIPSQSKLATYVLPCFMPLALLTGYASHKADPETRLGFSCAVAIWLIIGAALTVVPFIHTSGIFDAMQHPERITPVIRYGVIMGTVMLVGSLLAIMAARNCGTVSGFALLGITLMFSGLGFSGQWDGMRSTRDIVHHLPANAQLCAYGRYYHSAAFYGRRPLYLVGTMGELAFGQSHPNTLTISREEFFSRLHTRKDFYCLTKTDRLVSIMENAPNVTIVAHQGDMVLIQGSGGDGF